MHDRATDEEQQAQRRQLANGFGNTLTRAFEIAMVPVVLGLIGYGVDRLAGTRVVFAVLLAVLGLAGTVVKLYYGYRYEMEQHEADAPWRRQPRKGAA